MIEVSTIIPAYNAERSIAQAINSALSQDFEAHEVVVVNDGATDSTATILNGYNGKIQVVTQSNRGVSAARNAGVRRSTGKYLAFLDSDDMWLPEKLATMVSALKRNPQASLAFSEYSFFDNRDAENDGSSIGHAPSMEEMLTEPLLPILPSSLVIPREMFERVGGFCEAFRGAGAGEEWSILLFLRELGEFVHVPYKLTLYRAGQSGDRADKYAPNLPIFIALMKQRYGARGKALIRNARNLHCRLMLSKIAHQMSDGDRLGAALALFRIASIRPSYFFSSEFIQRLLLPHNMRRLRALASVLSRMEQRG